MSEPRLTAPQHRFLLIMREFWPDAYWFDPKYKPAITLEKLGFVYSFTDGRDHHFVRATFMGLDWLRDLDERRRAKG